MQQTCPACGSTYDEGVDTCPIDGFELIDYEGPDPLIGEVLDGRFRIDEILGEGGMGQVYRARQLSVDRDVAIKVMRAEYSIDRQIRERFFREARVISGLNHPNIVQLIDFGRDAEHKRLFLAMEFLGGVSLRDLVNRGVLRRDVSIAIISQALSGLAEAHASGIVHRDLKPDNLMVVPNADGGFQLKVLDFGIAHSAASEKKLTTTGAVMGTPHYMAPEQAKGRTADHRTDIYAMGAIFYEMLSGELTLRGESALQLLMKLATETPVHLSTLVDNDPLNQRLVAVVMSMLEREPDERPQTVTEINRTLAEVVRDFGMPPVVCAPESEDPFGIWFGREPFGKSPERAPDSRPVQVEKPLSEPTTRVDALGHETKGELAELEGANDRTTRLFVAIASVFLLFTGLAVWVAMDMQTEPASVSSDPEPVAEEAKKAVVDLPRSSTDTQASGEVSPDPTEKTEDEPSPEVEKEESPPAEEVPPQTDPPEQNDSKKAAVEKADEPEPAREKPEEKTKKPDPEKPNTTADEELEKRLKGLDKVLE